MSNRVMQQTIGVRNDIHMLLAVSNILYSLIIERFDVYLIEKQGGCERSASSLPGCSGVDQGNGCST